MGTIDNIDKSVNVIMKIADLFKKNGYIIAFFAILIFGLCIGGVTTYKVMTMDKVVSEKLVEHDKQLKQNETESHNVSTEQRLKAQSDVYGILNDLLLNLNGDRAYVIEMHNGNNNPSGLPFIYAEMTYEKSRYGIEDVDDEYTSLTLSRYQFPEYLNEHRYFYGTMEELYMIDPKLTNKMLEYGATHMLAMIISGEQGDIGMFGVTYCGDDKPPLISVVNANMSTASQKLTLLLDRNKQNGKK